MLFDGRDTGNTGYDALRARFEQFARHHATMITDEVFRQRAQRFEAASKDPRSLWRGDLGALPTAERFGEEAEESYTYFDHLVAEGSVPAIVAHLNRTSVRQRISELRTARSAGDVYHFIQLAERTSPGMNSSDAFVLARLLLDAELAALLQIDMIAPLNEGNAARTLRPGASMSTDPLVTIRYEVPPAAPVSMDDLFALWRQEAKPSASTLSTWGGHSQHFNHFFGVRASDLVGITQQDMVRWKNRLVQEGKAASTISRSYLGFARAMFRFAVANKLVSSDPCEGVKVSGKAKAGQRMLAYSNDEISRLLRHAETAKTPIKRWLVPLAAATGARIGELAQLHGSQIAVVDSINAVKIGPAGDGGSIKNAMSERTVPLHSALVDAGFLAFVEERGPGPLFYDRTSGDPARKHASKSVTNRVAAWIRTLGFHDPRKAPNHAIRHWFKTECARLKIEDSVVDAIQGHSDATSAAVYRHISLEMMSEAINRIRLLPDR